MLGRRLKVVQIDEDGVMVGRGPAAEAGEQVALANAGFAPDDGAESASRRQRLTGKIGQAREGVRMHGLRVTRGGRGAVDAIIQKRIDGAEALVERFQ